MIVGFRQKVEIIPVRDVKSMRACSSTGLKHKLDKREVDGSVHLGLFVLREEHGFLPTVNP